MIGHTSALKEAAENKDPPPQLHFDVGKENFFQRMLAAPSVASGNDSGIVEADCSLLL